MVPLSCRQTRARSPTVSYDVRVAHHENGAMETLYGENPASHRDSDAVIPSEIVALELLGESLSTEHRIANPIRLIDISTARLRPLGASSSRITSGLSLAPDQLLAVG